MEEYMKTEIKTIAKSFGGQIISRVEAKRDNEAVVGKVKLLIPKAITNSIVDHSNLAEINIKTELDKKKLTKKGDIILKLSQPYDAAYITEEDENLLVTSFCLILRDFDISVNPRYLLTVINSQVYREQAMNLTSGATVPILTKGSIEKIKLDILSLAEQDKIVDFADNVLKKEQIFNEIINLEKMRLENMLRGEF